MYGPIIKEPKWKQFITIVIIYHLKTSGNSMGL
jgi:hypothetical protein